MKIYSETTARAYKDMANQENIESHKFQKGQSGNPAGRPRGSRNRSTIMRELLEMAAIESVADNQKTIMGDNFKPDTVVEQLVAVLVMKALNGDVAACKELMDSAYGKVTDKVENQHSFVQMERVTAGTDELIFDVGGSPDAP